MKQLKKILRGNLMKKDKIKKIKIDKKLIGGNASCYIIAEIARTHNNNLKIAERMIKEAALSGVDAVKIQSIEAEELLVKNVHTAKHYQELKRIERNLEQHKYLFKVAKKYGVNFFSTPESLNMVSLLEKVGVNAYKIASLDLVYYDLLKCVAKTKKPIFLSTGMGKMEEIKKALGIIKSIGNNKIILLYCSSLYPPEPEEINLKVIEKFRKLFPDIVVGFSDHTIGITASLSSIVLGAKVIEKHFTLNRLKKGDDYKVSLNPEEMKHMVDEIRKIEKMIIPNKAELSQREYRKRQIKRRKIVAAEDLASGIRITKDLIKLRQTDNCEGIQSQYENRIIGKVTKISIKKNEPFLWHTIK
jgi:N,N'-diacetyllegionaminate synthase